MAITNEALLEFDLVPQIDGESVDLTFTPDENGRFKELILIVQPSDTATEVTISSWVQIDAADPLLDIIFGLTPAVICCFCLLLFAAAKFCVGVEVERTVVVDPGPEAD